MKAKGLEVLLGCESTLGEAEMTQRFQKLRDMRLLPVSRGRNAEDISFGAVVSGLLSIVAERPGFAGLTAKVLHALRPVGIPSDAFAKAGTFGQAMLAALNDDALLDSIVEIRMTDAEVGTNCNGFAVIDYGDDGETLLSSYYVHRNFHSLFHAGKEKEFDPHDHSPAIIRETRVLPRLLKRIVREVRETEKYNRLMAAIVAPETQQRSHAIEAPE